MIGYRKWNDAAGTDTGTGRGTDAQEIMLFGYSGASEQAYRNACKAPDGKLYSMPYNAGGQELTSSPRLKPGDSSC